MYSFTRVTGMSTDTQLHGETRPCQRTGLVRSYFRASDDAVIYPFNIPENALAVVELKGLAVVAHMAKLSVLAARATALANEIDAAIQQYGKLPQQYIYETDGFSSGACGRGKGERGVALCEGVWDV